MELISNMLFWLSNGMLIPDIIFLLFFFIKALLMIGGFYGTYIGRTKINVKLNREIGKTGVEEFLDTLPEGNGKSKLLEYLHKIKAAPRTGRCAKSFSATTRLRPTRSWDSRNCW